MAENTNTVFNEEQLKKWESQMSRILDNMAEGSERLINHTDRLLEHYRRSAENNFGYVDKAIKKIYESLADAEVSLKREKVNLINTVNAAAKEITNKEDRIATQEEMQIISRLLSLEAKRKEQEKSGLDTTEIRRLISKEKGEYNSKGYGTAVQISEKESVRENFEVVNKKETELSVLNDEAEKANEKMDETQKKAENLTKNITNFIEEVWHQIKGGAEMWMKYNDQAVAVGRRMGMSYKATLGYQQSLMANSKDLIRNYGMTADQAMKMQESFQEATGKASFLTKSQLNDVAASSKLMGEETVNGAITAMDKLGGGTEQATEILDKTFARAQNAGLDTNKTAKDLVANLEYANKLSFRTGVDGISRMTVLSERMKMNFGEVAKVADKFSTIEGAIQGSAQLQMLGDRKSVV